MTGEQKLLKLQDYVSLFLDPDDFRISEVRVKSPLLAIPLCLI